MRRLLQSRAFPLAVGGGLMLLLAGLAHLQWKWSGQVCTLERHRLETTLELTGARLVDDVDREITQVFAAMHPDLSAPADQRLALMTEQLARWRATAAHPRLVKQVRVIRPGGADPPAPRGALLIPLAFPHGSASQQDPLAGALALVELDEATLADELFPQLVRSARDWGAGEDVLFTVVDPARPGHVIYRSDPSAPGDADGADLAMPILNVRPLADLHRMWNPGPPHAHPPLPSAGGWQLLVRRRGKSVDEAVAALRWHNLAVSGGILALMALAAIVLVAATRRAQRLARQQIEFVAGITHELHTPLTAIRSAGDNLADGVVADPDQVRRYGALIEREGRRLTAMVAQLLEFSGIQSGRRVYRQERVDVGELVRGALADNRWLLDEAGIAVEEDLPAELPPVLADPTALRRGLQNLVENGLKYGGKAGWLGVRARATATGVDITVADRGPGVPRDELPHLFEPFFRGRDAVAGGVPGAGLGLALVRHIIDAHGGRVSVVSDVAGPETGTAVTLHLPAAPAEAAA